MREVVFSQAAEYDLTGLAIYIAQDSPARAVTFAAEVEVHARSLEQAPFKGMKQGQLAVGLRRLVHGSYNIYYRVEADRIVVLRILHGARRTKRKDFA